ncbi:hypothetical protein BC567DRAFT_5033 [Phyllosticta citribraziliensis]
MQASHASKRDAHKLQERTIGIGRGNRHKHRPRTHSLYRRPFDGSGRGRPGVLWPCCSTSASSSLAPTIQFGETRAPICPHAIPWLQTCFAPIPPSLPTRHGLLYPFATYAAPTFRARTAVVGSDSPRDGLGQTFSTYGGTIANQECPLACARHAVPLHSPSVSRDDLFTKDQDMVDRHASISHLPVFASLRGGPESTQVSLSM